MVEVDVEMTLTEFNEYWQPVFDGAQAKVLIKGFRPGQAPPELAKRAVDTEKVFQEAAQSAIHHSLNSVAQGNNWTLIDSPKIEIKEDKDGFSYHARLVIFPEIKLGDYKKIAGKLKGELDENLKKVSVSEKEIDDSLEWLKKSGANLKNFKEENQLRSSIQEGMKHEKEGREREKIMVKILDETAEKSEMDIPQMMIDKVGDKNKVARHLIIYKIAEMEKFQPTQSEVEDELQKNQWQFSQKGLDKSKIYDYIYEHVQQRKVYELLLGTRPEKSLPAIGLGRRRWQAGESHPNDPNKNNE